MDLVLLVHKDASVRETISSALSDAGCGALAAGTGEEGLSLMVNAAVPVAMIGLDVHGGTDGIGLLKKIKDISPETEVIVLPESSSLDVAISCFQAGACDYLDGPFTDPGRVMAAVARAFDRGRLGREQRMEIENLSQKNEVLLATNHFLSEQVKRDPLTGLYNHGHFQEILSRETARAARYHRYFSLVFADLDQFKKYNDLQGHLAGDKALVATAEILRRVVRRTDYIARYGGEEFVVLLPETTKDKAGAVADRIREAIAGHPYHGRDSLPGGVMTASMGISSFPENGLLPVELIRGAEAALFEAKRDGGNTFRLAG